MTKLKIDNIEVDVSEGTTILEAAKTIGREIPHFCYHPRLSIAGNCRMCLVEVEGVKNPVISCRETVREGMTVRTNTDAVKKMRADILEFILINHPLDCPICDQSGECRLQDYYFKYSLKPSRFFEEKVKKPKALRIGEKIVLDSERCVECTRCVRFCEEAAGKHEIGFYERGSHSTIATWQNGAIENPYSLCTVDLCPVGAITSADFRFKKRVWFLKSTASICTACAAGCNIFIDHSASVIYRYRPRANESVNKDWMCDDGRLSHKELENRILKPLVSDGGDFSEADWESALAFIARAAKENLERGIFIVLSACASLEENAALKSFAKEVLAAGPTAWSGRNSEPHFADKILRDADRNPNTAGVKTLSDGDISNFKRGGVIFILDVPNERDIERIADTEPALTVFISSQKTKPVGKTCVILPKAVHAEQDGTFMNRDGKLQTAKKAFDPIVNSKPVWQIASEIACKMGIGWEMRKE